MSNDREDVKIRNRPWRSSRLSSVLSGLSFRRKHESREVSTPCGFVKCNLDLRNLEIDLQNCPFDVTGYGHLILKDQFRMGKQKKKVVVFLFENFVIFNTIDRGREAFYYYGGIRIQDLSMPKVEGKTLTLENYTKGRFRDDNVVYRLKAKSEEIPLKWSEAIKKCLWKQFLEARDRKEDEDNK